MLKTKNPVERRVGWLGPGRAEKRSFKVSVDGDDLTIVKNRIYLT
jgi:hypothetical protein